nr:MAG TPA: hypothetical protein [Caudoviricetes sp.]
MKWNVSVGVMLSIEYDDIEAETEEEAMKIAKKRASEDDYDSLSTNYDKSSVYCTRADEEE